MEEGVACMNGKCPSSNSVSEWKKGWPLRSGGFATLCDKCGTAYQQLTFCEMFHSEETGWRECTSCGKSLHCGCIASSSFLELIDTGGVNCRGCSKSPSEERDKACDLSAENGAANRDIETIVPPKSSDDATNSKKSENDYSGSGEQRGHHDWLSSFYQPSVQENKGPGILHSSLVSTDLSISLCSPSSNAKPTTATSSFQLSCRPRQLIPRLPIPVLAAGLEANPNSIPQVRVARPPVEGRIKNQLLPRYWPRLTDQELQQISGDSNSRIVPLFEKVLSASDAGRIGRLVLPKACAEAYFPPISQPEGLPLRIQDVKGKEWLFQFRFWPNNNSRMYVLEGVTPCIQSMQLQAGDTVTFSRMDPGGKLLMGYRKASNATSAPKDSQYPIHNGVFQGELLLSNSENQSIMSGYSGFRHTMRGTRNPYLGNASKLVAENPVAQSMLLPERKRRNIGPKSKRLLIDGHDSLELTLSWEEVQDMLCPPPSVKPSTFSVEDHEFEEYEEPPVFAKRSIFVARVSGEHEQWTQCDSCFKWRKVPIDILLPPKWTCHENIYDHTRCSCSAPDELNPSELENLLKMNKDFTKSRIGPSLIKPAQNEHETPDPENPTNPSVAETGERAATSSSAATTKHPRHRPGCSCIVCIQPPSGKGKHQPTCVCNVCSTVKRRFKTLMMRKKKRQSEREAEIVRGSHHVDTENAEALLKGGLDLNCRPIRENVVSMTSLVREASLPLEKYLRQHGLTSLVSDEPVPVENVDMAQSQEDHGICTAGVQEQEEDGDNFSEKGSKEE
ncbi:B3 domain-containing transcription repressor VAL2 [Striga hermonthica]|uniref:B3 domain-containing transcription repressor VAL2 n=1 Tax=Striga hermonthica TaxID=68872 RepID=A0A9N7NIW0_STRHE|nr:B3 domain-containing transcription repressor VAL2 [Striga hermonthica]